MRDQSRAKFPDNRLLNHQQPDPHQEIVAMLRFVSLTVIAFILITLAALPGAWAEKPNLRSRAVIGAERGDSPQITLRVGSPQTVALQYPSAAESGGWHTMDLGIVSTLARAARIEVVFTKFNWTEQQEALLSGRLPSYMSRLQSSGDSAVAQPRLELDARGVQVGDTLTRPKYRFLPVE